MSTIDRIKALEKESEAAFEVFKAFQAKVERRLAALEAQEPARDEALPDCICGEGLLRQVTEDRLFYIVCNECGARTPLYDTCAGALACWKRMMQP